MSALLTTMRLAWLEAWTNRRGFWTQVTIMLVNDVVWVIFWVISSGRSARSAAGTPTRYWSSSLY